jgi:hypothetical protein
MQQRSSRTWRVTVTAAAAALAAPSARALQVDAPEDWSIRWANTV